MDYLSSCSFLTIWCMLKIAYVENFNQKNFPVIKILLSHSEESSRMKSVTGFWIKAIFKSNYCITQKHRFPPPRSRHNFIIKKFFSLACSDRERDGKTCLSIFVCENFSLLRFAAASATNSFFSSGVKRWVEMGIEWTSFTWKAFCTRNLILVSISVTWQKNLNISSWSYQQRCCESQWIVSKGFVEFKESRGD